MLNEVEPIWDQRCHQHQCRACPVHFISLQLKDEGYLLKVLAYTFDFVRTFILAVWKGVSLVEVHVAERIRISAGFFWRSFHSHFIHELPLLWIIFYVRPIHLANKGNLICDLWWLITVTESHCFCQTPKQKRKRQMWINTGRSKTFWRLYSKSADYYTFVTNQLCGKN